MLVFFIHGVATQNVKYAQHLEELIREEFKKRGKPYPRFYSSFWGDILKDVGKIWNWIDQDLQEIQERNPQTQPEDIFRYQQFRQGFLSEFVGDAFTYLNSERGAKIRKLIADQLEDFIAQNPEATELHIVAHSLGTVILWDILFSDRFKSDNAAFKVRAIVEGSGSSSKGRKIYLNSITTMGSPILLFNMMLAISPEKISSFANFHQKRPLRWINIIHSSDIIAYPLRSSLKIEASDNLCFEDKYIHNDANSVEKALRDFANSKNRVVQAIGLVNPLINEAVAHAPMIAGAGDGHTQYWKSCQTASLIMANILDTPEPPLDKSIKKVITRLKQVKGMTPPLMSDFRLDFFDETLEEIKFEDGSGKLVLVVNPLKIHHVYVFDKHDDCKYSGYVGLTHGKALKKEVDLIKEFFC